MKHLKLILLCIVIVLLYSSDVYSQVAVGDLRGEREAALADQYFIQGSKMSKEQEEKILKTLTPEIKSKMEEIKKLDKDKYYRLLRSSFPFGAYSVSADAMSVSFSALGVSESNGKYQKQKELEIDVELLALKYKNAEAANQPQMKSDLVNKLSELFEIREARKQEEIKQLENRLQDLKESLKVRKQNKDEIVNRRIQELLGNSKYLRWE